MLRNLTTSTARTAMGIALGSLVLLTSCDQRDDRVDRAKNLADAAMDQISGRTIVESDPETSLQTASIADRSVSGTLRNDLGTEMYDNRAKFAIGSIIAKPKDIAPELSLEEELLLEEALLEEEFAEEESAGPAPLDITSPSPVPNAEMAEPGIANPSSPSDSTIPDLGEQFVTTAQVMPKIKLDPKARERTEAEFESKTRELKEAAKIDAGPKARAKRARSLSPDAITALPPAERMQAKRLARRSVIREDAIRAQRDANSVMLDTLSKYGMGGEVALSRTGQMVIQIGKDGASPTQFSPAEVSSNPVAEFLAVSSDDADCSMVSDAITLEDNPTLATECIVQDLRASGQFEYVEKDFIFQNQFARKPKPDPKPDAADTGTDTSGATPANTSQPTLTPNDPLWALQWHFMNQGEGEGTSPGGSGFQDFWARQANTGSADVVVAVVDTGLQLNHPDIEGSPNVVAGWDMISDPRIGNDGDGRDNDPNDPGDMCDPTAPNAEDTFHGTHVAGTIGAAVTNNGSGVAGGAWNVKIVPVRALGKCGGRLSDINDAIRWAGGLIPAEGEDGSEEWNDNPADIINLSIGLFEYCPASLQDAIDSVVDRGVVVVSAAGNDGGSTTLHAPGGCNNVISVAAGDARGQIAPYSNFGAEVDVLAPGGDLTRDDNGDGQPDGVLSTKTSSDCFDLATGEPVDNCYYAYEQGTSMAAPHVSAALALLKAREPDATGAELTSLLLSSLDPRAPMQCAGACERYPGTEPIEGNPDMCLRPCGGGLLNLGNIPELASGAGSQ